MRHFPEYGRRAQSTERGSSLVPNEEVSVPHECESSPPTTVSTQFREESVPELTGRLPVTPATVPAPGPARRSHLGDASLG